MRVRILIPGQILELADDAGRQVKSYRVSTAARVLGEKNGSFQTPRGRHVIAPRSVQAHHLTPFSSSAVHGRDLHPELAARFPERDWILTRILWLSGCQPGINRLGNVDTMRRFIYIHGSPDSAVMGAPGSMGCIRMHTADILDLFDRVSAGTPVEIAERR
jgi:lipoprotein-anchoring transpeptidase ErfK/SrfK